MTIKLSFLNTARTSDTPTHKKPTSLTLLTGLAFILIITYLLYIPPKQTVTDQSLQEGDIAREDIVINKNITLNDKETIEKNKQTARESVIPIYEIYPENRTQTRNMITRWFELIRSEGKKYIKNPRELPVIKNRLAKEFGVEYEDKDLKIILRSPFFHRVDLNSLLQFVDNLYEKGIVSSAIGIRKSKDDSIKIVSDKEKPVIKKITEIYDLSEARMALALFIQDHNVGDSSAKFISNVLMKFIDINIAFSLNLTLEEEKRAVEQVQPVMITLKMGKVILRKGDEVRAEHLRLLKLIATDDQSRDQALSNFWLIAIILSTLAIFGGKFFKVWHSGSINKDKIFIVTGATLAASALVYRICIFLFPLVLRNIALDFEYDLHSVYFAIPFGFGALAMAFIFNLQSAVIFSFVNALIGGIICNWDFKVIIFILIGNLTVCFGIEFYQRLKRSPIIKASILWLLPVNMVMILVYSLAESNLRWSLVSVNMIMAIISAVLALILSNFIIPIWEILFKLVTELKLIELTNLNLPIFREMLEKAPGTYHHSQMVASLSENAALDLGLSPLLHTAMALYHDIGKIDNPHYFTENHALYKNPHENLTPRESAKNIVAHIADGLERADKIKLPDVVRSAIIQHHGTKLVRFFYDKAREMSSIDKDNFDDKPFRYQGEKPKNVENAVIMLADQVEAASKSLASPSEEELKNVIRKIIDVNINDNQFDECEGLTFKALNTIASSFHKKLSSIYHMRVSYPGFNFKEKQAESEEEKK